MPVLPEVGSTIVPPGLSLPSRSAASIMRLAMRSLLDPPGFTYSILASTVALIPSVTLLSLTNGVLPTRSSTVSAYFMGRSYGRASLVLRGPGPRQHSDLRRRQGRPGDL